MYSNITSKKGKSDELDTVKKICQTQKLHIGSRGGSKNENVIRVIDQRRNLEKERAVNCSGC